MASFKPTGALPGFEEEVLGKFGQRGPQIATGADRAAKAADYERLFKASEGPIKRLAYGEGFKPGWQSKLGRGFGAVQAATSGIDTVRHGMRAAETGNAEDYLQTARAGANTAAGLAMASGNPIAQAIGTAYSAGDLVGTGINKLAGKMGIGAFREGFENDFEGYSPEQQAILDKSAKVKADLANKPAAPALPPPSDKVAGATGAGATAPAPTEKAPANFFTNRPELAQRYGLNELKNPGKADGAWWGGGKVYGNRELGQTGGGFTEVADINNVKVVPGGGGNGRSGFVAGPALQKAGVEAPQPHKAGDIITDEKGVRRQMTGGEAAYWNALAKQQGQQDQQGQQAEPQSLRDHLLMLKSQGKTNITPQEFNALKQMYDQKRADERSDVEMQQRMSAEQRAQELHPLQMQHQRDLSEAARDSASLHHLQMEKGKRDLQEYQTPEQKRKAELEDAKERIRLQEEMKEEQEYNKRRLEIANDATLQPEAKRRALLELDAARKKMFLREKTPRLEEKKAGAIAKFFGAKDQPGKDATYEMVPIDQLTK